MEKRSLFAVLLCIFAVAAGAVPGESRAGAFGAQTLSMRAPNQSYLQRAGCGWDYPCAPQPDFGRPPNFYRRLYGGPGQPTIHNNYGTVNIQVDGKAKFPAPPPPCCEAHEVYAWGRPCGPAPCEEERPKEDCGLGCWLRRIREGYCGHGCWAYREQARVEAEVRDEKEERRAEEEAWREVRESGYRPFERRYDAPPPRFDRHAGPEYPPPPRDAHPKIDERTPLRRFEGPKYPAK